MSLKFRQILAEEKQKEGKEKKNFFFHYKSVVQCKLLNDGILNNVKSMSRKISPEWIIKIEIMIKSDV